VGPRFLPFADAATPELPLGRLLRLSLFQVTVGMAVVLLIGTLNRVMIVELGVPSWLVATMVSLPLVFAPFRALIGFKSDTHRSALGWRRVPYLWFGTLLQFGGLAIMPFALILLGGDTDAPAWVGQAAAALAFLMMGAGLHTVQTAGLALATDLAPPESQPKVVALLCVMMMLGMMASALVFGTLLADFSQVRLIQVIQGAAAVTMVVNLAALWKQEPRDVAFTRRPVAQPSFTQSWALFASQSHPRRRFVAVALGTMAFSMQDVLLEPYGGHVLGLSVGATTGLTAILAIGGLVGFVVAARWLGRGADPYRIAAVGTLVGIVAFTALIFSAPLGSTPLFVGGVALIGLGSGIFAHCTLTAAMSLARGGQTGPRARRLGRRAGERGRHRDRGRRHPSRCRVGPRVQRRARTGPGRPSHRLWRRVRDRARHDVLHARGPRPAGAPVRRCRRRGAGQVHPGRGARLMSSKKGDIHG
jgi:BCD family chlorophyll transporter-like MFS transporter